MLVEGIQSEALNTIHSNANETSGVEAEIKLNEVYGNKYRIWLDHEIITDNELFTTTLFWKSPLHWPHMCSKALPHHNLYTN